MFLQGGKQSNLRKARVWVESRGLFSILLFWLPLPNVYLVLPFLLVHTYTVNAYEFTGDSPRSWDAACPLPE